MEKSFPSPKLALIVPYRDREEHLHQFVPHMKKFLRDIPYRLFLIEQADQKSFNRGKLLNIGFNFAKQDHNYICLHDIDMLPITADYSFPESPTHLATHVEQFDYEMPYAAYFGGVTLFNCHDFDLINGYNNDYFGWGLEDDDLRLRCNLHGLSIQSREGTFLSLPHEHAEENTSDTQANRLKFEQFYKGDSTMMINGLITLKYELLSVEDSKDYCRIKVKI
jgi:predicted glycosyltransferase involved in capsule biosynthesis